MARGAWRATVQGVTKSRIGLNMRACDTPLYGQTEFLSFFFFFWLCGTTCGISVPQPGIQPHPLQGKCGVVLTTRLPKKFLDHIYFIALRVT